MSSWGCLTPWFAEGPFGSDRPLTSHLRTGVTEGRSGDRRRRCGAQKNNYKHTHLVGKSAANKPREVPGVCPFIGSGYDPFSTVSTWPGDSKKRPRHPPDLEQKWAQIRGQKMGTESVPQLSFSVQFATEPTFWPRIRGQKTGPKSGPRFSPNFQLFGPFLVSI